MKKHISKAKALLSIVLVLCLVAVMLPTGVFTLVANADTQTAAVWSGDVAASFGGGAGKKDDPFLIANGEQLALLAADVNGGNAYGSTYFKLTADIDLGGKDWTPIGGGTAAKTFQGIFDGDDHTIRNLSVTGTTNLNFGFFGQISNATIKNLHLTDAVVTAGNTSGNLVVGGLVGKMNHGSVLSGCSFDGTVTTNGTGSNNRYVGALVGWYTTSSGQPGGEIVNCFSTGSLNITTKGRIGGLVGIVYASTSSPYADLTVRNSYSTMDITVGTTSSVQAAGLVANVSETAVNLTIENSFFAGTIDVVYPFTYASGENITIKSDVYVKEGWCTKTGTITPGGAGVDTLADRTKTADEFKNGTVTKLLNGNLSIWMTGKEHPVHKRELPTLSTLAVDEQVIALAKGITAYEATDVAYDVETVEIAAATTLQNVTVTVNGASAEGVVALGIPGTTTEIAIVVSDGVVTNTYTVNVYRQPKPWNGTDIEPFAGGTGTEDDPYLIANAAQLYFLAKMIDTKSEDGPVAAGGQTYPALTGKNIYDGVHFQILADIDLNNQNWDAPGYYVSASDHRSFAGSLEGGNHTVNNLSCSATDGYGTGLFSSLNKATVKNLLIKGTVTGGANKYLGGIAGRAYSNVTFINCGFEGTITGTTQYVGGLIGYIYTGTSTFMNCWTANGTVQGGQHTGGLLGFGYSQTTATAKAVVTIENCYSTMTVKRTSTTSKDLGGLVGNAAYGTLINCYFFGALSNPKYPISGGAVASAQNVFYLIDAANTTNEGAAATGKTAAEFADGTVTNLLNGANTPIWATSTAGYPVLTDLAETVDSALSPVGTSIRSKGDSQGIRFKFTISNEAQTTMLKEAGVVVAQLSDADGNIKAELEDENLVMHDLQKGDAGYYKYVAAKAYEKGTGASAFVNYTDDKDWFAAALVNFNTAEKLTNKYIARSYAIFTDARGQEILVYSDVIGDKNYHVSVEDVAQAYYDDENLKAQLTEEELSYVKGLVLGASWYANADWNGDGVLKILAIGNSFSDDSMNYVYDIAQAAGVQEIYLGHLYYAGCTVEKHLSYAQNDSPNYEYRVNTNGKWTTTTNYILSDAVKDENWDFISFQQGSAHSGRESTYDCLDDLMDFVTPLCTNPKVKFVWHMTWAYQQDCTQSAFANYYEEDQMTMYNAILSSVQNKIVPNDRIVKIIPNGTAIQNARTSYIGDNFTRDGYHLHKPMGRFIAGLSTVETLIGIDWNKFDIESLYSIYPDDETYFDIAVESVQNAVAKPFEITESEFAENAQ